jgi:AAA+ ATPase superfamily predicted ATPase
MHYYTPKLPKHFIGRANELISLEKIAKASEARLVVVYGRRRIGKTTLIEYAYSTHPILKFEGIEGAGKSKQITHVIQQLAQYRQEPYLNNLVLKTWTEVFELIYQSVKDGPCVLYFEEVQWLANYQEEFIAELKFVWDNYFRRNDDLILILCGSSPSFIINHIIHSKSLYNRSQYELPITEFNLKETQQFLNKTSQREVMDAYLTIGGIPEYLKWLKKDSSVFLSLCNHAFVKGGFFVREHDKIFTSSMSENKHYKNIIEFLSKHRFATRRDLMKTLKISSGGSLSSMLYDLEICGFINSYIPYNMKTGSYLTRYCIADNYLQFYFHFIEPKLKAIENNDFFENPAAAINQTHYIRWLGFAFERFCRKNHQIIATILGFSAVQYLSGAYFNKRTQTEDPGYQIDLLFDRADHVLTICEIKYTTSKVSVSVVEEFERKLALLPQAKNTTIQKVLISANDVSEELRNMHYFDNIITLADLFAKP